MQLTPRLCDSCPIITVDHEYQALGAGEIMPPERTDLVLAAHVPDVELDVLVSYGFDIEADGRNCGDVGIELEFVEDC